jgi:hypothetical protein
MFYIHPLIYEELQWYQNLFKANNIKKIDEEFDITLKITGIMNLMTQEMYLIYEAWCEYVEKSGHSQYIEI